MRLLSTWLRWNTALYREAAGVRANLVIATDFDTLLAGYLLKRKTGCLLIYDAHELWVDLHSHTYLKRPFRWACLVAEGFLGRRADLCITVCRSFSKELARRHSIPPPVVVYNGAEKVVLRQDPGDSSESPLRAYYQGLAQTGRGLDQTITAMGAVCESVHLTIQGPGARLSGYARMAEQHGLDSDCVEFLDPCTASAVSECASAYDVGIVVNEPCCLNNMLTVPNRLFTLAGGSLAILATDENPEVASIVRKYECGICLTEWTAGDIAEALDYLAGNAGVLSLMQTNARKAAGELSWDSQFAPVVEWLSSVGFGNPTLPASSVARRSRLLSECES
jgi:glycosyltransferase involved in cell wall biosynthesis